MNPSSDLPLDRTFPQRAQRREVLVQDRPTLGSMPRTRRGIGWWLVPVVDFVSSSVALAVVALLAGVSLVPALPVAPLILVGVYGALGVYGASSARGGEDGPAWPVIRLLAAALFAWSASLLTDLGGGAQLGLWAGFVALDTVARRVGTPVFQRLDEGERWILVGDERTSERLRAYEPLRDYARIVATVPPGGDDTQAAARVAALEVVERYRADRVVIASQHADDEGLLELVRAFKSIGVPVSLLPRPLDLLEAPEVTQSQVGGVPLLEALGTVQGVVGNRLLVLAIGQVQVRVREGKGMARPLSESGLFPALALNMIAVGEETGKLDTMLAEVASYYDQEVRRTTKSLTALLEPALILVMGLIIGVVVISMLLAIFSINDIS